MSWLGRCVLLILSKNIDTIIDHDVSINVNKLASKLNHYHVTKYLYTLMAHGADVNTIVSKMSPSSIAKNREKLLAYGANLTD